MVTKLEKIIIKMEFSLFRICGSFWFNITRIILFVLLIVLIPFGCPLLSLFCYLLRSLMSNIAHIIYGKSLGKLLTIRGVGCAQDRIFEKPQNNIVVKLNFSSRIDIGELRGLVRLRLLQEYLPGAEEKYPELKQYLFSFLGYYFWKVCDSFDICEHVQETRLQPQPKKDQQSEIINSIVQECVNKPWREGKPLWEIILVNLTDSSEGEEEGNEESVLIFTIHHCLADGYSILCLLRNDLCGSGSKAKSVEELIAPVIKPAVADRAIYIMSFLFKVSWDMSQVILQCLLPSVWKPKRFSHNQTWNIISKKIPLRKLRDIKNHFKVSFSSLIVNLVSGGIRNALTSANKDGSRSKTGTVVCIRPVPLYPRGPKLRNFMAESLLHLPVELEDTVERLRKCNETFNSTRSSPSLHFLMWYYLTIGSMPNILCELFIYNMPSTAIISNFPGGDGDAFITTTSGNKIMCTDASFTMGLTIPTIGTGFTILSYGDYVSFSVIANKSLYSKHQAELLLSEILIELDKLHGFLA